MKCLELKPKTGLIPTDYRFLAKIPFLPSRYLWENEGANLALLASEKVDTLLVITDNEGFLKRYRSYYAERFEVSEHGDDYRVAGHFETIHGKVRFDNEPEDLEEDGAESETETED